VRRRGPWIEVRDSKNRRGPVLKFESDVWSRFVASVKSGEFDSVVRLEDGFIVIECASESSKPVRLDRSQYRLARWAAAKELATSPDK
jgi:hypothetical protein